MSSSLKPTPIDRIDIPREVCPLYEIHWIITRRCTYACYYCPPHRHNPISFEAGIDTLKAGLLQLKNLLNGKATRINITGGEPTKHPTILEFLIFAFQFSEYYAIRIITNLSMPKEVYSKMADIGMNNKGRLQVVSSYHFGQARLQAFIERLTILLSGGLDVQVKMVVPQELPPDYTLLVYHLTSLKEIYNNLNIRIQHVRGTSLKTGVNPSLLIKNSNDEIVIGNDHRLITFTNKGIQITEIKEDLDDIISRGENHFFGWCCDAGLASLFIDNDGLVYSALCKPDKQPLFNLFTDNSQKLILPAQSLTCPHIKCECAATIRIPKRRGT